MLKRYAVSPGLRRSARSVIDRLPVGRTMVLRAGRSVLHVIAPSPAPRAAAPRPVPRAAVPADGRIPRRYVVEPRPTAVSEDWPSPPPIADPFCVVRTRHAEPAPEPVFDIELFETLNAEYAARPLVASPLKYDDESMASRARDRLVWVHNSIDLRDRRVLEFGCGGGFEVWLLGRHFGADAWGVDVQERASWSSLNDERTHLVLADLAVDRPFEPDYFDRVYSFYVFEHVEHPFAALQELYRVMKPGGLAWIAANLHRGPMASHRYKDVHFPFPHLLFDDDVFREFYRRQGKPPEGAAWVNRLTWAEYEDHIERIGFRTKALNFRETPLDEEFYARFECVLGRYPKTDLTRDFFEVVLEKPLPGQRAAARPA
jgi:SAM-dependent methyltransferase